MYGYEALLHHYKDGKYAKYLDELFKGTKAHDSMMAWLANLERSPETEIQKAVRLASFLEQLVAAVADNRLQRNKKCQKTY